MEIIELILSMDLHVLYKYEYDTTEMNKSTIIKASALAVTFLEYWKRKNASLAHHWDCMGFQVNIISWGFR